MHCNMLCTCFRCGVKRILPRVVEMYWGVTDQAAFMFFVLVLFLDLLLYIFNSVSWAFCVTSFPEPLCLCILFSSVCTYDFWIFFSPGWNVFRAGTEKKKLMNSVEDSTFLIQFLYPLVHRFPISLAHRRTWLSYN